MRGRLILMSGLCALALLAAAAKPPQSDDKQKEQSDKQSEVSLMNDEVFVYRGELFFQGEPLNGKADLEFRLFENEFDTQQLGSTVAADKWEVDNGLVLVALDFHNPILLESGAWLEITVDGTILSPRQFIPPPGWDLVTGEMTTERETAKEVSEIMAFLRGDNQEKDTEEKTGNDVEKNDSSTDQNGSGLPQSSSVSKSKGSVSGFPVSTVSGGTAQPDSPDGDSRLSDDDGEGTAGAGDGWKVRGSDIVWTRRKVGIGTRSPSARLHVKGSVRFQSLNPTGSRNKVLVIDSSGNLAYRTLNPWGDGEGGGRFNYVRGSGMITSTDIDGPDTTIKVNDNSITSRYIASNAVGSSELANNAATTSHIVPDIVSSIDGVRNDGGDINFIAGSNMTITPNNSQKTITFSAQGGGGHWDITGNTIFNTNNGPVSITDDLWTGDDCIVGDDLIVDDDIWLEDIIYMDGGYIEMRKEQSSVLTILLDATNSGTGYINVYGSNTYANVRATYLNGYPNNGHLAVYDSFGNQQAGMYVDSNGNGYVFADGASGGVKAFRMPNPSQPGTNICYASVEGPEAAAYIRGTGRLKNGRATIELPQHFQDVSVLEGMTVQLTPRSYESKGLATGARSLQRIEVGEMFNGRGNYEFDWEIKCVRAGYEDYRVIRPTSEGLAQSTLRPVDNDDTELVETSR